MEFSKSRHIKCIWCYCLIKPKSCRKPCYVYSWPEETVFSSAKLGLHLTQLDVWKEWNRLQHPCDNWVLLRYPASRSICQVRRYKCSIVAVIPSLKTYLPVFIVSASLLINLGLYYILHYGYHLVFFWEIESKGKGMDGLLKRY